MPYTELLIDCTMKRFLLCALFVWSQPTTLIGSGASVTVTRDHWGVAHIHGKTDADAFFGMGYVQAEDFFWQLEDSCIRALGRYSEVVGADGVRSDILNRSFGIVRRAKEDYARLIPEHQIRTQGFVDGINHYLETHPDEKPRLITRFEPWHTLAMDRHALLDFTYRLGKVGKPRDRSGQDYAGWTPDSERSLAAWDFPAEPWSEFRDEVRQAIGSNAWAISGKRTKSGRAMLFINPHQPWYGMGSFYEAHIRSDSGLNYTGACFYGTPFPTLGHNEYLGWAYTVNDPDIADAWTVSFDDPDQPLDYRYDDGYRTAEEWQETLQVKTPEGMQAQKVTFRRTHHGPVVRRTDDGKLIAVKVAGLFDRSRIDQAWQMVIAKNYQEWREAMSHCAIPMFNVVYADRDGNIFYAYNGTIPRRDPEFDWTKPVDGSDPATEWKGIHTFDELPQVFNPDCGYVQSCNSAPYTTCDSNNPNREEFPAYMLMDADVDMRRSKMSRRILGQSQDLTFDELQALAYDTRLYWALTEIPELGEDFKRLQTEQPDLAKEIAPVWKHLQDWDFRASAESTQTTLMVAWYEELYGLGYPAETLKEEYQDRLSWFGALKKAAGRVRSLHGNWRHPWGKVHRLQRVVNQSELLAVGARLNPLLNSLPCAGTPGPLGIIFTVYSSPEIPLLRPQRFSVVGPAYMSVVEFTDRVRASSVVPFGASGRPNSKHFFDQARLLSERKLKPAPLYTDEVNEYRASSGSFER